MAASGACRYETHVLPLTDTCVGYVFTHLVSVSSRTYRAIRSLVRSRHRYRLSRPELECSSKLNRSFWCARKKRGISRMSATMTACPRLFSTENETIHNVFPRARRQENGTRRHAAPITISVPGSALFRSTRICSPEIVGARYTHRNYLPKSSRNVGNTIDETRWKARSEDKFAPNTRTIFIRGTN